MEKNPAQEEAIRIHKGQVLLVSCPGSGKTTTMLRRIHSMIQAGIPPASIIMVTFTEASAREMRERYYKNYGKCQAIFCTIHSLCLKILSSTSGKAIRILSAEDQMSLIRTSMKEAKIPSSVALKDILNDISVCKNRMSEPGTYNSGFLPPEQFSRLFSIYQEKKQQADAMDFDDLLCKCLEAFIQNPFLLEKCQKTYQYIICDEYQDTNRIQKEILYLLAGKNGNLCVVGDDDQSIYGFRGASPDIMMDFKKDFPGSHEIHMNINYRSRPAIITASKNLIEHNTKRFPKNILSSRGGNGDVITHSASDKQAELQYLATEITNLHATGFPLSSIAVLSRTNQELEDVAAELENRHLEYCSNEPIKDIYEHFIFKDLMAYLNLADGVFRPEYLLKILNRPNRYLMESAFKHIREFTEPALTDAASSYSSHYRSAPDRAVKLYSEIHRLSGKNLYEKVADIADRIGYRKYLTEYSEFTGQHKDVLWEKLNYFITDSKNYSDCNAWYSAAISHIQLHHAEMKKQTNKGIVLSTMHRSKGLEWDTVFIINCCEGYTPISKAEKVSELEEERRLFYVAMTRAREKLYLLNHASNPGSGRTKSQVKPSLFLSEINGTVPKRNTRNDVLTQKQDVRRKEIENEFEEGTLNNLKEGMKVHHKTYGVGFLTKKTMAYVMVRFKTSDKIFFI